jgi:hypothetical protein
MKKNDSVKSPAVDQNQTISNEGEEEKHEETFIYERISTKIEQLSVTNPISTIVFHQEGSYPILKALLDRAKLYWRDQLAEVNHNVLLNCAKEHNDILAKNLKDCLLKDHGFGTGQAHEGRNCNLTYRTFLQANDERLQDNYLDGFQ